MQEYEIPTLCLDGVCIGDARSEFRTTVYDQVSSVFSGMSTVRCFLWTSV
jgi:hypothetical protein